MSSLNQYCQGLEYCFRFAASWHTLNTQQRLTALRYYKRVCNLEKKAVAQRWLRIKGAKDALDGLFTILLEEQSDDIIDALCLSEPRTAQGPSRNDEPKTQAQA